MWRIRQHSHIRISGKRNVLAAIQEIFQATLVQFDVDVTHSQTSFPLTKLRMGWGKDVDAARNDVFD